MDGSAHLSLADTIDPSLLAMSEWQWPDVTGPSWHSAAQTMLVTGDPVSVSTSRKAAIFVMAPCLHQDGQQWCHAGSPEHLVDSERIVRATERLAGFLRTES